MARAAAGRIRLYGSACRRGGHTPQLLQEAFAWHLRFERTGSMLEQQPQPEAVPA